MPIAQTAKQAAISAAKQVAKQTLNESNEFLKAGREQILPSPEAGSRENKPANNPSAQRQITPEQEKAQREASIKSMMRTYEGELNEIKKENLFKDLQRKISEGEYVPLEEYQNELSFEQREVLKAQMEVVEAQKQNAARLQQKDSPIQAIAKRGRNAMKGMFKKKNEQHVETRQPPSG